MKGKVILLLVFMGLVSSTITGVPQWIGKFQMMDDGGLDFAEWLNVAAAALPEKVREAIVSKTVSFEIQQVNKDTYTLTITDIFSGHQHQETFKIGKWLEVDYFGSGKVKVRWTHEGKDILDEELDVGGVKSYVLFDFSKGDCKVYFVFNEGEIKASRFFKRILK